MDIEKIIDLSQEIYSGMPVYPGSYAPVLTELSAIDKEGIAEKMISMSLHTGTHIDVPAHMIRGGWVIDMFEPGQFIGDARIIDISGARNKIIELENIEHEFEFISQVDFILFYTGWDKNWGRKEYFRGFPVLSHSAVSKLAGCGIKGIGIDAVSVDPVDSLDFKNHRILFENNLIIIENLTNLNKLLEKSFLFSCFPLRIKDVDSSPVHAYAIVTK